MAINKNIYVYADWESLKEPILMGMLSAVTTRGTEVFSFEYGDDWIKSGHAQEIDPDLQLFSGRQYINDKKPNFGIFMDSSPDRWGRTLMKRREAIMARKEKRKPRVLQESDFLLGVYDQNRMGGLRYKLVLDGDFLSADKELSAPPLVLLRDLEYASLRLEEDKEEDDNETLKWLNMLMAPGSSLGGARPKASVKDPKGNLWIAKFPSKNDDWNIGAWEYVAMHIAQDAGVRVGDYKACLFSGEHCTFLSKRFDRTNIGDRIHFASAMTLLGYNDGANYTTGVSYLELAEYLMRHGARVDRELKELWTRIVLNICLKNTDDHLRNHGFLLSGSGWILSPVYDVNPFPEGTGLTLNISEDDNSLDLDLAMSVIGHFRLKEPEARTIIDRVKASTNNWRKIAETLKIPRTEQNRMEEAFVL